MKKTLILILVVLMALFAVSVITAQTEEPVQTDPAAVVTEPAAEGAEPTSDQPAAEEKQPEEQPAAGEEQPQEESNPETPAETPDVTEEGGDTPSDTPAATEENLETPTEAPAATEENVETPTEAPAAAEENVETPTDTPEATEEGSDTPTDTPDVTEENVETPTDTPAAAEGTDETPADTPEVTDTPDPAEAAAPDTTAPAPAEDEDSVIYMTVTIAGTQLTVKYDENDTNTYTAEGFTVLSVDCTNEKGEPVACPSFNEKKDLIFDGTDRAELPGNKIDRADMGLSEDQFSLDLKAENVEVSFVVIDGYVEVVEDYTEPEVIDQTGTDEPVEEPAETPEGTPEETEPEGEDQETEKPAEEASDDVIVYSSSCMTIRLIKKPAEPVEEPAGEPAAEPAAAAPEGEEENADELNENEEELNNEGEDQNGDDLNKDTEDLKDEDKKENIEEQNENDEEKGEEENAEDQDKDEEEQNKEDLKDEDEKENIEEQNEKDENEQNEEDEEKDAEDTDKDGFHTIISGDGSAAGVTPEIIDPAAGEGENTEAGEETAEDTAPKSIPLTEDMVIFTAADAESEALAFTFEEGMELTVLSVDENGWAAVEFSDGTQGYVRMPAEEEQPETEPGTETAEGTESVDDTPKTIALTADMVIFTAADAESEALAFTFEEGMELTILSVDENGWATVEFSDGTLGYIQMPAGKTEEPETEPGTETEADETPKSILLTADMVIFTAADAESEALAFTFEEGMELIILSIDENGWAEVLLPDGTLGYIQMPAEEAEEAEAEEADETPKSILLTADMVIFTAADAESEALAFTFEEGMKLTILSIDENGWATVEFPDGTLGYIQMPAEEPEEADDTPKSILLTADMVIFTAADAESEAIPFTFEEGMELTVISFDPETGWALVELPDGTQGYILMPVEKEWLIATAAAATNIRVAASGMSAIFLTLEKDIEVKILEVEGDWVKVELPDGRTGYIFIDDIEFEGKPEKVYIDKKVTIFSDRRPEMAEGETVTLTSKLEGFEDCEVIIYQWECDKGNGFEDIEGANSESFSYQISKETLPWSWCLTVYYK